MANSMRDAIFEGARDEELEAEVLDGFFLVGHGGMTKAQGVEGGELAAAETPAISTIPVVR